jgi:hypothetical protein
MPGVVELRVHGVGGATPEGLLGVATGDDTVLVAGEATRYPYFSARRVSPPYVEGYLWGALTARPLLQPLWILLLPFSLLNVAGWMHPRRRQEGDRPAVRRGAFIASRVMLVLLGLSLTASYGLWLSFIVTAVVQPSKPGWVAPVALLALTGAVLLTANLTQRAFERIAPPDGPVADQAPPREAARSVSAVTRSTGRFLGDERFQDAGFWSHAPGTKVLLWVHTVLLALVAAGSSLLAQRWTSPGENPSQPFLPWINGLTLGQLGAVVALAVVVAAGWAAPFRRDRFRFLAPAVPVGAAVALTNGFFSQLATVVRSSLQPDCDSLLSCITFVLKTIGGRGGEGDPLNLSYAFGVAVAVTAGMLAVLLGFGIRSLRAHRQQITLEGLDWNREQEERNRARERGGLSRLGAWRLAGARTIAGAFRQVDLVLTALTVGFVGGIGYAIVEPGPTAGFFDWFGRAVLTLVVVLLLVFLWRRARQPDDRRKVGTLWDVMTFWPRRFHPFAVRPYAERAVPEIEHRLVHHVADEGRPVLVSAHSQGTVLVFAALLQLAECRPKVTRKVAVVTFGSPLFQLYERYFPDYIDLDDQFPRLLEQLYRSRRRYGTWRNFYRKTDYIGQDIFEKTRLAYDGLDPPGRESEDRDVCLPDPASDGELLGRPIDRAVAGQPDINRVAWVDLAAHSSYRNELRLKLWVERTRRELCLHPGGSDALRGRQGQR